MISANDLRRVQLSSAENGYSVDEVNAVIDKAADTIDAMANENQELYHKLEVLAAKIEEYRSEEDSIKTALITAQKMADKITKESKDEADALIENSNKEADATVAEAKEKAESLIAQARQYASDLLKSKTDEANGIVGDAEKKANEAISSAKLVAQDIVSQAKDSYTELTTKAKEEKEAYEILIAALKKDAAEFINKLKTLYAEQFSKLDSAKIDAAETAVDDSEVASIHSDVDSLLSEMDDIQSSIPDEISIEKADYPEEIEIVEEEPETEEPVIEEPVIEEPIIEEPVIEETIVDEEPTDPMAAVEAFSQNEYSPIDTSKRIIPEINEEPQMEEKSLFDDEGVQPFESFFEVSTQDAHLDKTQQISLLPPDEDEDDDSRGFKGFFRKKK